MPKKYPMRRIMPAPVCRIGDSLASTGSQPNAAGNPIHMSTTLVAADMGKIRQRKRACFI